MGRAIIGGVITSTLLTLVVVPVLYTYLDGWTERRARAAARRARGRRRGRPGARRRRPTGPARASACHRPEAAELTCDNRRAA